VSYSPLFPVQRPIRHSLNAAPNPAPNPASSPATLPAHGDYGWSFFGFFLPWDRYRFLLYEFFFFGAKRDRIGSDEGEKRWSNFFFSSFLMHSLNDIYSLWI